MEIEDTNRAQGILIVNAGVKSDESGKGNAHMSDEMEMELVTNTEMKEMVNAGIQTDDDGHELLLDAKILHCNICIRGIMRNIAEDSSFLIKYNSNNYITY